MKKFLHYKRKEVKLLSYYTKFVHENYIEPFFKKRETI